MTADHIPPCLLAAGEGVVPKIEVIFTPSDEVTSLRSRVNELEMQLLSVTSDCKKYEWRFCCMVNLQMQLNDYLREHNIKIPKRFLEAPF